MAEDYLKCQKCGCENFIEYTMEECAQKGVLVRNLGETAELEYDSADTVEILGISRHESLECMNCGTEHIIYAGGKFDRKHPATV